MSSNSDVQTMTETAKQIFNAANVIVENMAAGSRIQIKELAAEVGNVLSLDPKVVLGFVNHYVHETTIAYVTRGKKGGLIKGVKPLKTSKPRRSKKLEEVTI